MTPPPTLPQSPTSVASRLCQECGLCCNGVLFHTVRLQPSDSPRDLSGLGIKIKRKRGQDFFSQPCSAFLEMQCGIYAQRPSRCRLFECRQLKGVQSGTITVDSAMERIHNVQERVAILEELSLRADGKPRKGPLSKRCETALAEPIDASTHAELAAKQRELARGLQDLEDILDAHFRLAPEDPAT